MINLFEITETIGIISFAFSGFLIGVREKCDILGVTILAVLTALGGGIIRDILVNEIPYSITNLMPVSIVLCVVVIGLICKLYKKSNLDEKKFFIVTDSIGLVSFSITGALVGLKSDINVFGIILLAFFTAVGGGIIRDIMINQVSFILKKQFYGTVPILIGVLLYDLNLFNLINPYTLALVFITGLFIRLYVYFKNINLPVFE